MWSRSENKSNLYEIVAERASKSMRERERGGVVLCNKSEKNLKDETHYPCSRNTRVMRMNASKNRAKMNRLLKANGEYNKMHKSATVSNDSSLFLSALCTCCKTGCIF